MSSQQTSRDHAWPSTTSSYPQYMMAIPIEDDDLTFGGKSLSTWYEEDRRRYSDESYDEPDERGRTRYRAYEPAPTSHHGHHKHGHKHHKKSDQK